MFLCPAYHLPAQDSQIIVLQGAGVKAIENELESLHPFQQELVGSMYAKSVFASMVEMLSVKVRHLPQTVFIQYKPRLNPGNRLPFLDFLSATATKQLWHSQLLR
jgi:hypothetical protein